jgi:hypothetical protein
MDQATHNKVVSFICKAAFNKKVDPLLIAGCML